MLSHIMHPSFNNSEVLHHPNFINKFWLIFVIFLCDKLWLRVAIAFAKEVFSNRKLPKKLSSQLSTFLRVNMLSC